MVEPGSPRGCRTPGAGRCGRRRGRPVVAALAVAVVIASAAAGCGSGGAGVASGSSTSTSVGSAGSSPGTAAVLAAPVPTGSAPGPDPATGDPSAPSVPSTAATVPEPAPLPIGTVELALVDPSRPTVSRGVTISASRSLPTVVAYPTGGDGPRPLLVFAHGYRLGPPGYSRLMATLAAAGYVVAAPSFPLADEARAGSNVDRGDLPNQPGDLSFVIDQVLGAASEPSSPLAGRVDASRIGAVGHSDGADTVLDLGYTAGRSDPRVRAVVALSPDAVVAVGTGVGGATPLLVAHGDADDVVPISESRSVFANVSARRYLLTLLGAGHLPPVAEQTSWTPVLDQTIAAFLDRYVAGLPTDDAAITGPASTSTVARIESAG